MTYRLKPEYYPSRADWTEYTFHHTGLRNINNTTSAVKRILLHDPVFPSLKVGEAQVTQLAVVINSNLGLKGMTGAERSNVLTGKNLKQITYNLDSNGNWTPICDINTIEYPSDSSIFTAKLRMFDPTKGAFSNIPRSPVHKWEISVQIV